MNEFFQIGLIQFFQGRLDDAKKSVTKSLNMQESAEAFYLKGRINFAFGLWDEALQDYSESISIDGAWSADVYYYQAYLMEKLGWLQQAITSYQQAITLAPKSPQSAFCHHRKSIILSRLGFNEQTKSECDLMLSVSSTAPFYWWRGVIYARAGQSEQAIEMVSQAIEMNPGFVEAISDRAYYYTQINRYDLAVADCDSWVTLEPENPIAYNNRGCNLFHLEQYQLALKDFTKAIELSCDYSIAYRNRGQLLRHLGELSLAEKDDEVWLGQVTSIEGTYQGDWLPDISGSFESQLVENF